MLIQELQLYLDKVYPNSKIESENSIVQSGINIRFELGGILKNGTIKRVNQAKDRALTLFNDTFVNPKNEIWVLIYEYPEPNPFGATNEYLYQQFPATYFDKFYIKSEKIGNQSSEVRIIIGKLPLEVINIDNILKAIANKEMGFSPSIDQTIFFFDPFTNKGFNMYDDRGCLIFSNRADEIKDIYTNRAEWIVEYYRKEIDKQFIMSQQ